MASRGLSSQLARGGPKKSRRLETVEVAKLS